MRTPRHPTIIDYILNLITGHCFDLPDYAFIVSSFHCFDFKCPLGWPWSFWVVALGKGIMVGCQALAAQKRKDRTQAAAAAAAAAVADPAAPVADRPARQRKKGRGKGN